MEDAAFPLDPRLAADTIPLGRTKLCRVLLMDERRWPWVVLVPERPGAAELFDLDDVDRHALLDDATHVASALARAFAAEKTNVAAIGNVVRQLHVHVVLRHSGDPAWPGTVWGRFERAPYDSDARDTVVARVREALADLVTVSPSP